MKKEFVTYSEAFKMQVVEEISRGKFATILHAQKAYGICGMNTIRNWIKKYGREDLLPKRVRVETLAEIDELKEAKNTPANFFLILSKNTPAWNRIMCCSAIKAMRHGAKCRMKDAEKTLPIPTVTDRFIFSLFSG
jgi:transposase-like protein